MILHIFFISFIVEVIFGFNAGFVLRYTVLVYTLFSSFFVRNIRVDRIQLILTLFLLLLFGYHLIFDNNLIGFSFIYKLGIFLQTTLFLSFLVAGRFIDIWSNRRFIIAIGLIFLFEIFLFGNYRGFDNRFYVGDINPILASKHLSLIGLFLMFGHGTSGQRLIGGLFIAIGVMMFGSRANLLAIGFVIILLSHQISLKYRVLFLLTALVSFFATSRFENLESILISSYARLEFWKENYTSIFTPFGTNIYANSNLEYPHNWLLEVVMLGGFPLLVLWIIMLYRVARRGTTGTNVLITYLFIFGMFSASLWTSYEFWLLAGYAFSRGK